MDKCELNAVGFSEVQWPGKGEIVSGNYTTKKIRTEVFEELRNVVLEENGEDKMIRESNEQVLGRIEEKRTLLNNILRRKANQIGHILRRNCLLHDAIEGQMTEVKGVGRRRTQLLDDVRNRRRYWEIKEEAEDRKVGDDSLSIEHKYLP